MATITVMPSRILLRLSGPALKFLHDVSTQDVAEMQPGDALDAAFLDEKGRVLADARITANEDGAIVDAEEAALLGLERAVARVAPLAGVEVVVERCEVLRYSDGGIPLDTLGATGIVVTPAGWGGSGIDLVAPSLGPARQALLQGGASEGDPADAETERIAAGRPRFGIDIDENTLINETPLLAHSVAFAKGCYPGQESVARVHNLGRVRSKLRVLAMDAPVATGDVARAEYGEGMITSASGLFAMAFLPATIEPGTSITAGGTSGEVTNAGWE